MRCLFSHSEGEVTSVNICRQAQKWWSTNVSSAAPDYRASSLTGTLARGAGIGAAAGAAVGGGLAAHNVLSDEPYFDYVSTNIPKAEFGPSPSLVFGSELERLQALVRTNSAGAQSADKSLQYLAFLQSQDPKGSVHELTNVYQAVEDQFGNDDQVRGALNLIASHSAKYGSSPGEAYYEFSRHAQWETDFDRISQSFAQASKLQEWEINETTTEIVKRHTTTLGHLGLARGALLGMGAGAVVGAGVGVAVGALVHLVTREG